MAIEVGDANILLDDYMKPLSLSLFLFLLEMDWKRRTLPMSPSSVYSVSDGFVLF